MADNVSKEVRSEIMSQIRGEHTGPELALRRRLHAMGHRYRLHAQGLPGRPDIVFRKARVAVFVHGCFWHGCGQHFSLPQTNRKFWEEKIARNRARDQEARTALEDGGWRVVEVWEHDLNEDPDECADRVSRAVKSEAATRR